MKKLLMLFLILSITNAFGQETKPLTYEQKVKDFEYLFEVLSENYGYFGVNRRLNGIDWLSNKNHYIDKIKNAPDDTTYLFTLKSILADLNNDHVSFSPTLYYNGYLSAYKNLSKDYPKYKEWVEVLEKPNRHKYWSDILEKRKEFVDENTKTLNNPKPNYYDSIIDHKKIAIMSISSFNMFKVDKEKVLISNFLYEIKDCKYLIIDIQENGGGSTKYWQDNIVSQIIKEPIVTTTYPIIKDGEINRRFYHHFFERAKLLNPGDEFSNLSPELLSDNYYYQVWRDTIFPKNPIGYDGEIYLLVSKKVFSSSEGFAQFCKTTNWATVVGEQTGGDGVGSDPAIVILPESGIFISYPSLIGLNHSGSLNAEEKTVPDIEITGNSSEERLKKLINYLSIKK